MGNKTKSKNSLTLPIIKKMKTVDIIKIVNGKKIITTYTKDEYLLYLEKENKRLKDDSRILKEFSAWITNRHEPDLFHKIEIINELSKLKEKVSNND